MQIYTHVDEAARDEALSDLNDLLTDEDDDDCGQE
jgi:hypothetical protein